MGKSPFEPAKQAEMASDGALMGPQVAGAKHGCSQDTIRRCMHRLGVPVAPPGGKALPETEADEPVPTRTTVDAAAEAREDEVKGDAWTINLTSRTVQTYDQLVAACGVDLAVWGVESFRARSYQVTIVPRATRRAALDPHGRKVGWIRPSAEPRTVQMFAVSAAFRRRTAELALRAALDDVVAEAAGRVTRTPLVVVAPPRSGYLLGLSIADAHNGKLCWGVETGGPDYDLKLAVAAQEVAFETLLARSAHVPFERVLLVLGNDGLHVDSNANTTTKGTPQDVDGRHFKTFQATWRTYVDQIERARQVAPVLAVVMPGNHDGISMLHLGEVLAAWFRGDPHVEVDNRPRPRKYVDFGRNLIGVQHGDRGKPARWSQLMPVEAPESWAASRHRTILTGHLHRESMEQDEVNGVKVWRVPSLAPPDYWHAAMGFVGQRQAALAFHWHADEGLVGTAAYTHSTKEA